MRRVNANTPEQAMKIVQLLGLHAGSEWDIEELEHGLREITVWHPSEDDPVAVVRVSPAGRIYRDDDGQVAA